MRRGRTSLIDYKLYVLDWPGRIAHVVELTCEGDAEAIRLAQTRADGRTMELWRGPQMIKRFSSANVAAGGG